MASFNTGKNIATGVPVGVPSLTVATAALHSPNDITTDIEDAEKKSGTNASGISLSDELEDDGE